MTCKLNLLEKNIENIRIKLHNLSYKKKSFDNEVVQLSQKLDDLLNRYNDLK